MAQSPALYESGVGTIDYTPGADVIAGEVILIGTIPMIAPKAIADGVKGALVYDGIWKVPQKAEIFTAGDAVYWDNTGDPVTGSAGTGAATGTAAGNDLMGFAAYTTAAADDFVLTGMTAAKRTVAIAGSMLADDITGSDSTLNIAGLAAAQGGLVSVTGGVSATTGNVGGVASLVGGVGGATANGGAAVITGGDSAAGATGTGGDVTITGGANANTTDGAGGAITVAGGLGKGTGDGGAGTITGGGSGTGSTGAGGAFAIAGGAANSTNGAGGAVSATGGAGVGTGAGGAGSLVGGEGGATGNGGAVAITGGATVAGATGTGGAVAIAGGVNANTTNGAGGAVSATGGAGKGTGDGGAVSVVGGASGTGATGVGGSVSITGGEALSTNDDGGDIILTPGVGNGSGESGVIRNLGISTVQQGAPNAQTGAVTLTIANILTGIITGTHSVGSTQNYTLPTGTLMSGGVATAVGDSFDWVLINLSAAAADTVTIAVGADHTIVGNPIVQSAHSSTGGVYGNSAVFRSRMTGATTWVTYRIG